MDVGKRIEETLELLADTCEYIQEAKNCSECPMHLYCLEDGETSFMRVCTDVPADRLSEFVGFGIDCRKYMEALEFEDYVTDMAREADREEREEW